MKKSNIITLISICVLIVTTLLVWLFEKNSPVNAITDTAESVSQNTTFSVSPPVASDADAPTSNSFFMGDALFIGDSRTVGLMEYAQIANADFFANTGMSVFNIHKKPVSVPNVGKVGDMAADNRFFETIEHEIQKQMKTEMEKDGDLTYWTEDSVIGKDLHSVSSEHNFYCCFHDCKQVLYASPHVPIASKIGFRLCPSSVSVYSTRGGTSA